MGGRDFVSSAQRSSTEKKSDHDMLTRLRQQYKRKENESLDDFYTRVGDDLHEIWKEHGTKIIQAHAINNCSGSGKNFH